jgi:hypothetical protein
MAVVGRLPRLHVLSPLEPTCPKPPCARPLRQGGATANKSRRDLGAFGSIDSRFQDELVSDGASYPILLNRMHRSDDETS